MLVYLYTESRYISPHIFLVLSACSTSVMLFSFSSATTHSFMAFKIHDIEEVPTWPSTYKFKAIAFFSFFFFFFSNKICDKTKNNLKGREDAALFGTIVTSR